MEKKLVYDLHEEHVQWINKMLFYKDEIKVMQNRLSEVAGKNTNHEVQALVEHFQNQLIVQNEQADILKHTIKQYENTIESHLNKNDVAADKLKWNDHSDLREKVEMFEKIINELRGELIDFLAKYI
jgi:3-oxoacyl-[acyl-carrier-protein] synthase III